MFKAVGFTDDDLRKPLIGVANTWIEIGPCNYHLNRLAAKVKEGIRAAGGTPLEFNTVSISDGITMGVEGMKASLISREVIADSIELVGRGNHFDGLVCISGCDKTNPGVVMALARLDIPGLVLYGGSIAPGHYQGRDLTIQDVYEAVGKYTSGKIDEAGLKAIEDAACPGAGACGGQFTANTMSTVMEFLGISPMGSNSIPAMSPDKDAAAFACGQLVMQLLRDDLRPSRIITKQALENAIVSVAATGGSTNAVLHLLAIAHEVGVDLDIDDFDRISAHTPIIADLKPGGRFAAADLHRAGGIQLVAQRLIEGGYLQRDAITVTGRSIAEEASKAKETPGQEVVVTTDRPLKSTGGLLILKGNLSPEGCPVKMAGHNRVYHRGPARVFDGEEAAFAAVSNNEIKPERRRRHSLRRTEGRSRHARNVRRYSSARRRRPRRRGRLVDRWAIQRRHARLDGRARRPRSGARRPDRRGARRRLHRVRHREARTQRGNLGGRAGRSNEELAAA